MVTSISRGEQIRRASVAQRFNPLTAGADARAQAAREGKSIEQKFSEQIVSSGIGGSQQAQAERRVVQEQTKVIAAAQAGSVQAQKSVETQLKRGDIREQFIQRRDVARERVALAQLEPTTFEPVEMAERPVSIRGATFRPAEGPGRTVFLDDTKSLEVDLTIKDSDAITGGTVFRETNEDVFGGTGQLLISDTPVKRTPKLNLFEQPTIKAIDLEGPEFRFETPTQLITQLRQGTIAPR